MTTLALAGTIAAASSRPLRLSVGGRTIVVESAVSPEQRASGLSGRDLGCNCGMLFVAPDRAFHAFWMKDTFCPLSIAFLRDDGTIVSVADMTPMSLELVRPTEAVRLALEVPLGWFRANGVGIGDRVVVAR